MANKHRFDVMKDFFEGVGEGHAAGIWEEVPQDRPEFRKKYAGMLAARQGRGGHWRRLFTPSDRHAGMT
jgi:hypothetical protein